MRWQNIAYAARYGNQQISSIIGRQPTDWELDLFCMCIEEWRKTEVPEALGGAGEER